jgi:rsbT co-antagonist protein RsbR
MKSFFLVAQYLIKNVDTLALEIAEDFVHRMKLEIPKEQMEQGIVAYTEFIGLFAESLTLKEEVMPEGFTNWIKKNGEREVSLAKKVSDVLALYPMVRIIYTEHITNISINHGLSAKEVASIIKRLNHMIDISIKETIQEFERLKEIIIKEAQGEINELSAPIVPVRNGVAVLPLIGTIDTNRAKFLLEKVVPKVAELKIHCLIMDFSGIVMIDTAVANHIFKIHHVLRLLGININVTGIRPELAQTIVNGGIDLTSITTYATVQQAIEA